MRRLPDPSVPPAPRRAAGPRTGLTRRTLLRRAVGAGGLLVLARPLRAAGADARPLATRVLGRTGARVTVLGLGTAPIGEGPVDTPEAARIFGEVLDRGVTYVDTARIYGNAEEALGLVLPPRRDRLFVASKVSTAGAQEAERSLGESLRLLKTDRLDLLHIHSVGSKDIDRLLAKDGALEYLLKQKEAGKVRFLGVTSHNRPANVVRMVETGQIDVAMYVMNYADRHIYGFEDQVLPACRKRNVGVVAMKVYVGIRGGFPNHKKAHVGCVTKADLLPQALAYALDLEGVSVAAVGPYTMEQAVQNVALAAEYAPLTAERREALLALGKELAPGLGPRYGPVV